MVRLRGADAGTGPPSLVLGRPPRRPFRYGRARPGTHPVRMRAVHSNPLGCRTLARAPVSTAKAMHGAANAAQTGWLVLRARTTAAPWRNRGSLCRCSLQSAGQHSSPDGYLADSAASATPPLKATSAAPLPAHKTRACTRGGDRALAALDTKPSRRTGRQEPWVALARRSQAR